ncbi:MAG: hypothetical protein IT376_16210 [Polyangiaceae bacterium]|nr:hypothetical protein [Polyangiaceae bacterium]
MHARFGLAAGLFVSIVVCGAPAAAEGARAAPSRPEPPPHGGAAHEPVLRLELGSGWVAVPLLLAGTVEAVGSFPVDRYGTRLPQTTTLGPLVRAGLAADSGRELAPFGAAGEVEADVVSGWSASPEGPPARDLPPRPREVDQLTLRRAHARVSFGPYVHLGGGFMVNHWGLGLVGNDGAHGWAPGSAQFVDPRGGDRVLRGYVATGPVGGLGLGGLVGLDRVEGDDNLLPGDEAHQLVGAILAGQGKPHGGGVFAALRRQETRDGRELEVMLLDATARGRLELSPALALELATELAWVSGTTTFVPTPDHPEQDVQQLGGVMRGTLAGRDGGGVLDLVYAGGDRNLDDDTQHGFRADPSFATGLLLYRWVMAAQSARTPVNAGDPALVGLPATGLERTTTRGAVTNTIAVFPRGYYRPVPELELYGGPLFAWSAVPLTEPFNTRLAGGEPRNALAGEPGRYLGTELDLGARARVAPAGVELTLGVEGGLLLPGAAFEDATGEPPPPVAGGRVMLEVRP